MKLNLFNEFYPCRKIPLVPPEMGIYRVNLIFKIFVKSKYPNGFFQSSTMLFWTCADYFEFPNNEMNLSLVFLNKDSLKRRNITSWNGDVQAFSCINFWLIIIFFHLFINTNQNISFHNFECELSRNFCRPMHFPKIIEPYAKYWRLYFA